MIMFRNFWDPWDNDIPTKNSFIDSPAYCINTVFYTMPAWGMLDIR